jgi:hypothetical protein
MFGNLLQRGHVSPNASGKYLNEVWYQSDIKANILAQSERYQNIFSFFLEDQATHAQLISKNIYAKLYFGILYESWHDSPNTRRNSIVKTLMRKRYPLLTHARFSIFY